MQKRAISSSPSLVFHYIGPLLSISLDYITFTVMVGNAAINISGQNRSYWFHGDKYVALTWTPGTTEQTASEIHPFNWWGSLRASGFTRIDAILPIPGYANRAYWFSDSQFMRVEFTPDTGDTIIGSVQAISEGWPSLAQAGFDHIDAACIVPGTSNLAYIFSGEKYCRVSFTEGQNNSELIYGPKPIAQGWAESTFKSVDMVLSRPGTTNGLYMFSGDKYVEVNVVPWGTTKLVKGPNDVATDWPALHSVGFY